MITLFHGDNFVSSRQALNNHLAQLRTQNIDIIKLDSAKLTPETLTQALESNSLFNNHQAIVIHQLLSLPKSALKTQLLNIVISNPNQPVIIYEKKPITSAQIKQLGKLKSNLFKTSKSLFQFLDSVKPKNSSHSLKLFHQTIDQDPVELVFYLLVSRIAQLIQIKDDYDLNQPAWKHNQLKQQAQAFNLNQLVKLHSDLLKIDYLVKSGQTDLSVASLLDLLLINM